MNTHTCSRLGLLTAILLGIAGCGGPYDASVSGLVTLDGQPLPRGTVSFKPDNGGPPGYSIIDSDGQYAIRTGREMGLPSADYSVTVIANEPAQRSEGGGPPPSGKPITPPWYRTKQTSGLQFTVERGKNEINLELTTDPPADWQPRKRRRR